MTLLIIGFWLIVIVALYVVWGRKWLKAKTWPWSKRFFEITEPIEILLWSKSETILWSRFFQVMGALAAVLTWFGALDVSPYVAIAPERFRPWLMAAPFAAVTLAGVISELLRRQTSKPLELVAVSDNAAPAVLAEVARAEVAKDEAVATVAADKPVTVTKE
jgi:hypothetical protein